MHGGSQLFQGEGEGETNLPGHHPYSLRRCGKSNRRGRSSRGKNSLIQTSHFMRNRQRCLLRTNAVTLAAMTSGLREHKRRQVAHELAQTAFEMTAEKGLNGFTIDELTERAGYSRRTFTNYYSCKEEAVTAVALEQLQTGIASLPKAPEDLPLIDWVHRLAQHQFSSGLMDVLAKLGEFTEQNPTLEPYVTKVYAQIRLTAWQVVHDRFSDRVSPQQISILVGSAYGALTMMLLQSSRTGSDGSLSLDPEMASTFLDAVFEQLKSGF